MDIIIALGISIGVLAGVWTVGSISLGLITWAGFLSWASFYAAGGETKGLKDAVMGNISGVIWGAIIIKISSMFGGSTAGLGVAVAIGACAMCWQAKISHLSFIPGAFIGCATFFGTSFDVKGSIIALVLGAVLGYVSQQVGKLLAKKEETNE